MIEEIFLKSTIKAYRDYKELGDKTFLQLEENDFQFQPNEESNSIAILIQHLHGNMLSRWINFLMEDGEKEWRKRDDEFEVHSFKKDQLLEKWEEGWQVLFSTLESLQPEDLSKTVFIRTQPLTVTTALIRQLAHYSGHVGQIVMLGKIIRGKSWQTLSIPKRQPGAFNDKMIKK